MNKTLLYIGLLFSYANLFSQENNCIEKHQIYSQILQEEREYLIFLPANYEKNVGKTYPVIYLLDGESFFQMLTTIYGALTRGRLSVIPESIIVGVISTDRTRDFTPTKSAYQRDGTLHDSEPVGGESDSFSHFLTQELRTIIDEKYRTNSHNTLVGYSYAGLFAINTLLKHTESFETYIAIDPSLWWDNAKLSREAEAILKNKQFEGKKLYVGVATQLRLRRKYIHFEVMNAFLQKQLPEATTNGLIYYSKQFDDENHGSIPLPSMWDAFKQIYEK